MSFARVFRAVINISVGSAMNDRFGSLLLYQQKNRFTVGNVTIFSSNSVDFVMHSDAHTHKLRAEHTAGPGNEKSHSRPALLSCTFHV